MFNTDDPEQVALGVRVQDCLDDMGGRPLPRSSRQSRKL